MGKKVRVDSKNRVYITVLKDVGVFSDKDLELEIVPNSMTGIIHKPIETVEDCDNIIESLDAHKNHYELEKKKIKKNNEEDEEEEEKEKQQVLVNNGDDE